MATQFDHEKLDVYRVSIEFVAWAYKLAKELKGPDRPARDQLLRASQSIVLNIAEGNGKRSGPDRRRFLQIAYGSALECGAILDVLKACEIITAERTEIGKLTLRRIVAMLVRMSSSDGVREDEANYGFETAEKAEYEYECRPAQRD